MRIKLNDNVVIISGKDRGRKGKVIKALPGELRIVVEGINIRKKHVRPKTQGAKGQVVEVPAAINVANVKLLCPQCKQATRVCYVLENKQKSRSCKKCKAIF